MRSERETPVVGIIAEYNPFHQGHAYQIEQIRSRYPEAAIVVALSGSFTQRGEPAILDKWTRAEIAVRGGANLVLELPYVFACRSADFFALGGVRLLAGLVDVLAFGAEETELARLEVAAWQIDSVGFQQKLHVKIAGGLSYATALSRILSDEGLPPRFLHQPNNILAVAYLRAIAREHEPMRPLLIPRQGAGYHELGIKKGASAQGIRSFLQICQKEQPDEMDKQKLLAELKDTMPLHSLRAVARAFPNLPDNERLFRTLCTLLWTQSAEELRAIAGMNEGLEHRLATASHRADSCQSLIDAVSTSRYAKSRIARLLSHIVLHFMQEQADAFAVSGPLYRRVLAFDERGRALLHKSKTKARLPIISKVGTFLKSKERYRREHLTPLQQMLALDTLATELRELMLPQPQFSKRDFLLSPRSISKKSEWRAVRSQS